MGVTARYRGQGQVAQTVSRIGAAGVLAVYASACRGLLAAAVAILDHTCSAPTCQSLPAGLSRMHCPPPALTPTSPHPHLPSPPPSLTPPPLPPAPLLQGFSNPKWVDGELLVFDDDNPFVQGAQLGFTYDVGQHQR